MVYMRAPCTATSTVNHMTTKQETAKAQIIRDAAKMKSERIDLSFVRAAVQVYLVSPEWVIEVLEDADFMINRPRPAPATDWEDNE